MLRIKTIPTDLFDANCYIVDVEGADLALVIDPGVGAARRVRDLLFSRGQHVGGILLTHGHADHIWDAQAVGQLGGLMDVPVYISAPDRHWLDDPMGFLGLSIESMVNSPWVKPLTIKNVPAGAWQILPDLHVQMIPAPGHSPGSAIFLLADAAHVDGKFEKLLALSADVVFAGGVGRTDLPGGNEEEMRQSLRTLTNVLNPETVLLPGHGPKTTWSKELLSNQYVLRAGRIG